MNSSAIPRPALFLGLAGLIPFAGLAAGIVFYPEPNLSYFLGWLVQYGALERTDQEFRALLRNGGFDLTEVVPTRSPLSIILARPMADAG